MWNGVEQQDAGEFLIQFADHLLPPDRKSRKILSPSGNPNEYSVVIEASGSLAEQAFNMIERRTVECPDCHLVRVFYSDLNI